MNIHNLAAINMIVDEYTTYLLSKLSKEKAVELAPELVVIKNKFKDNLMKDAILSNQNKLFDLHEQVKAKDKSNGIL